MALSSTAATATRGLSMAHSRVAPFAAWALPFLLIVYLGVRGGGYDQVVRGEVGLIVWWALLLLALTGALATGSLPKPAWAALGLLSAFAVWTGIGIGWAESPERGAIELARVGTLLGIFLLALVAQGRHAGIHLPNAVTSAITLLACLALLSRLHPAWFPANDTAAFLPTTQSRLSYPLNYWNALGALMAFGIPLALGAAASARTLLGQATAAAAIPVMALTLFLTLSRGSVVAAVVGLAAYFLLTPNWLPSVLTLSVVGAGSAILVAAATQRQAVADGVVTSATQGQGHELLAMVLVVCVAAALIQVGIGLAARHARRPQWVRPRRQTAVIACLCVACLGATAIMVSGAPDAISEAWAEFKDPQAGTLAGTNSRAARFQSVSGNGRYQYWASALNAQGSNPLVGIGPGGFEFWWAREGSLAGFVRDAHSLYFETIAEQGLVGLLLLGATLLVILGASLRRAMRAPPRTRALLAGGVAACVAFCASATIDWVWEVTVLPVVFLLVGAALLRDGDPGDGSEPAARTQRRLSWQRLGVVGLALAAIVTIAVPLASTVSIRESQAAVADGRLGSAALSAGDAQDLQPSAAAPSLQRALILELAGSFDRAGEAARHATRREPTNWRNWLVRSRIEARRGDSVASLRAYRKARSLNPRSPLFAE